MPLTSDPATTSLAYDFIDKLKSLSGKHPGQRPAHAKGLLLSGTFTPTQAAKTLSSAPHFSASSTPVTARFSNFTGLPAISDNDPNANPRGLGLRFHLGERKHTDIVMHSVNGFPAKDGPEFLAFLNSLTADADSPEGIKAFLGSHPAALAFVMTPKPVPSSFAEVPFYAVSAFHFIDVEGKETTVRYRVVPTAGEKVEGLSEAELAGKSPNFLFDELHARLAKHVTVTFKLVVQIAKVGDVEDNATVPWPESRELIELGEIKLSDVKEQNEAEQKHVIFDPVPRVDGIRESKDPLFGVRADAYLISGKERRAA